MPGRAEDMRKIGEALATMKRIHNVMPIPLDRIEIFDEEYRPSFDKGLIECDDYLTGLEGPSMSKESLYASQPL